VMRSAMLPHHIFERFNDHQWHSSAAGFLVCGDLCVSIPKTGVRKCATSSPLFAGRKPGATQVSRVMDTQIIGAK
jgi:hypothetical protein